MVTDRTDPTAPTALTVLPVDQIGFNPANRVPDDDDLPALADNIQENGLISPITVCHSPPGSPFPYRVIAGNRRLAAFKLRKWDAISAILLHGEPAVKDTVFVQLAENRARRGLTPIQDVDAIDRAKSLNPEMNGKQLAAKTGYTTSEVSVYLAIAACPVARAALADGLVKGPTDAYAVARAATADQKERLIAERMAGATSKSLKTPRKPKQADAVRLSRCTLPLTSGTKLVVTGPEMTLSDLIETLAATLRAAKESERDHLDIKTFERVLRDKSKAKPHAQTEGE